MEMIKEADIRTYTDTEHTDVRYVMIDGAPWFVAVDISNNLGLTNTTVTLRRVDKKNIKKVVIDTAVPKTLNVINEAGIKQVINSSYKDTKDFGIWLETEVFPASHKRPADDATETTGVKELSIQIASLNATIESFAKVIATMTANQNGLAQNRTIPAVNNVVDLANVRKAEAELEKAAEEAEKESAAIAEAPITQEEVDSQYSRQKRQKETVLSTNITDEDIMNNWRKWCRSMISKIAFQMKEDGAILSDERIQSILWSQTYEEVGKKCNINLADERNRMRKARRCHCNVLDVIQRSDDANLIKTLVDSIKRRAKANNVDFEVFGLTAEKIS